MNKNRAETNHSHTITRILKSRGWSLKEAADRWGRRSNTLLNWSRDADQCGTEAKGKARLLLDAAYGIRKKQAVKITNKMLNDEIDAAARMLKNKRGLEIKQSHRNLMRNKLKRFAALGYTLSDIAERYDMTIHMVAWHFIDNSCAKLFEDVLGSGIPSAPTYDNCCQIVKIDEGCAPVVMREGQIDEARLVEDVKSGRTMVLRVFSQNFIEEARVKGNALGWVPAQEMLTAS